MAGGSIDTVAARDATTVHLRGAIDADAAGELRAALVEAIVRQRPVRLVIDLARRRRSTRSGSER